MTSLLQAKKTLEIALIKRNDIIGIGINEDTQKILIYINCEETCDIASIPGTVGGYPVEIVPIGTFEPLSDDGYRTYQFRPVVGGISAGHKDVSTGTISAVIRDKITGNKLILSNNHVFANTSSVTNGLAQEGDEILQPGHADGGTIPDDVVATLYRWVPFLDNQSNLVDAALALPINQDDAATYILSDYKLNVIPIRGVAPVTGALKVKKYSRTSDVDWGKVIDWNFTVGVDYKDGVTRYFTDQLLVQIQTQGGDSGSLLLDENDNAVGLIFAGGQDDRGAYYGVANKIRNVLIMFGGDVDITDGWSSGDILDPAPKFEYPQGAQIPSEEPDDTPPDQTIAIPIANLALAGVGVMGLALLWEHLNRGEMYNLSHKIAGGK
jgi:hypothetical protein